MKKLAPSDGDRIDRDFVREPRITNYQGLSEDAERKEGRREADFLQNERYSVTRFDEIDRYMLSGEIITSPFNSSLWASKVMTRILQADETVSL